MENSINLNNNALNDIRFHTRRLKANLLQHGSFLLLTHPRHNTRYCVVLGVYGEKGVVDSIRVVYTDDNGCTWLNTNGRETIETVSLSQVERVLSYT